MYKCWVNSAFQPSGLSGGTSLSRFLKHRVTWSINFVLLSGWDACQSQYKFISTHLYTWVKIGTVREKCLAQEHSTVPRPGVKPRPLDPMSSNALYKVRPKRGHIFLLGLKFKNK